MARRRATEPKRHRRTLDDGSVWDYLYDRQTGESLGRQLVVKDSVKTGSVAELIRDYRVTAHFKSRKTNTREDYNRILNYIQEKLGDFATRAITPVMVQAMKESLQDTPSKANKVLAMLSILFTMAVRKNMVQFNPAAHPGKLTVRKRTEIWSKEDEARVLEAFRPSLRLAFMLMLYTCQRLSDVLEMTTSQIDERDGRLYITLRQQKTDELIGVPVHKNLDPFLRERLADLRPSVVLVSGPQGLSWQRRSFSKAWDTDLAKADAVLRTALAQRLVPKRVDEEMAARHRTRHDLRRTGIVRLGEAGATTAHIASLSGHQIDYCQKILDTYLPRRTETALAGIEIWEKAGDTARVVRLADVRGRRQDR